MTSNRRLSLLSLFWSSLVASIFAGSVCAETVSMQSNQLDFTYRVDDAADVSNGNMDFVTRGIDYGVNNAWFLSTGGNVVELTGGNVVIGGPVANSADNETTWTVNQGDLQFRVDFYIADEFRLSTGGVERSFVGVSMDVEIFNTSTTTTTIGSLLNYSEMFVPNQSSVFKNDTNFYWREVDESGNIPFVPVDAIRFLPRNMSNSSVLAQRPDVTSALAASLLLDQVRSGDSISPIANGTYAGTDFALATQWDFELAPQESLLTASNLLVSVISVPEPNTATLVGFFLVAGCSGRRRHPEYK